MGPSPYHSMLKRLKFRACKTREELETLYDTRLECPNSITLASRARSLVQDFLLDFLNLHFSLFLLLRQPHAEPVEALARDDQASRDDSFASSNNAITAALLVLRSPGAENMILQLEGLLLWKGHYAERGTLDGRGVFRDEREGGIDLVEALRS